MLQPECKYGSNDQMDNYNYNLHTLPMGENYGKRPVRIVLNTNVSEHLDVGWFLWSSLTKLRNVSKVKILSFMFGLMLTFIVIASYVLMWDKEGLLFTLPPFQLKSTEASSQNNLLDMKLLAKSITSKLNYAPRKVPDEKDVFGTDPQLFSVIPQHFLPGIKSPCWYEEFSGDLSADLYSTNLCYPRSINFKTVSEHLRANLGQHLHHKDGKLFRLRCLPFFYIIGQPKCGTTDLFRRVRLHPEVKFNIIKEPHWWTRKRYGYIRLKDGFNTKCPLEDYLGLFDLTSYKIQEAISGNSSGDHLALQLITGEASASTMWDNHARSYLYGETEPRFLAQDFIHKVQPGAKIIIMLRDPVERLYSDYLYFKMVNKSADIFHQKVVESVQLFQSCLSEKCLRSCVYNASLSTTMPVRLNLGIYIVYLLDWLTVFHRDQILVLRLEDYSANLTLSMKKVFDFLNVDPLSNNLEAALTKKAPSNTRRAADRNLGPMLPATRELLREFHKPLNQRLASVLNNDAFLWRTPEEGPRARS